jgi:hypothetical protein
LFGHGFPALIIEFVSVFATYCTMQGTFPERAGGQKAFFCGLFSMASPGNSLLQPGRLASKRN